MSSSRKIGIMCIGVLVIILLIIVITRESVSGSNTIEVKGYFYSLERINPRTIISRRPQSTSLSYNLYLQQSNQLYKISPDWVHCFDSTSFRNEVQEGDLLEMRIAKDNGLRFDYLKEVVALTANGKDYIATNCVNERIENSKIALPVFFLLGGGLVFFLIRVIKSKNPYSP